MTTNQTCFPELVQSSATFFSACIFTPLILTIVLTIYFFVRRSKKMQWKENTVILLHVNLIVGMVFSIFIIVIHGISLIPEMMYLSQKYWIQYFLLALYFFMTIGHLFNSSASFWSLYCISKFQKCGSTSLICFLVVTTVSASLLAIAILAIGSDKTELECMFFLQFIIGWRCFNIVSFGVILSQILAGLWDLFIALSVNTRVFMIGNCNLRFDALQIVQLTKGTMIISLALAVAQILCIVLTKKMVDISNEFFKNFGPFLFSIVLYLPLLQVCVLLFILRKRNPKVNGKIDPINATKRMWEDGPKNTENNSLFFTNCSPTPVSVF